MRAASHRHEQLVGNLGNIALLRIAGNIGLIDEDLELFTDGGGLKVFNSDWRALRASSHKRPT